MKEFLPTDQVRGLSPKLSPAMSHAHQFASHLRMCQTSTMAKYAQNYDKPNSLLQFSRHQSYSSTQCSGDLAPPIVWPHVRTQCCMMTLHIRSHPFKRRNSPMFSPPETVVANATSISSLVTCKHGVRIGSHFHDLVWYICHAQGYTCMLYIESIATFFVWYAGIIWPNK